MKTKKDQFWIILLIVVVLVILVRIFVFEFVNIAGESMVPTLRNGQLIGICKVNYTPERGDIVVLDAPNGMELVKRVIGLPGETLEIKEGVVYVDGEVLKQKFQYSSVVKDSMSQLEIPAGSVFVMGDNRDHSTDSRAIGPILIQAIRGKMIFAVW